MKNDGKKSGRIWDFNRGPTKLQRASPYKHDYETSRRNMVLKPYINQA